MNNIDYIALELDRKSRTIAMAIAGKKAKELGWENTRFICHHMTISHHTRFTEDILTWFERNEGKDFDIEAYEIGFSEKAIALKLRTEAPTTSHFKHITLCVNLDTHGKPVDSNFIENWEEINPLYFNGTVKAFYKH